MQPWRWRAVYCIYLQAIKGEVTVSNSEPSCRRYASPVGFPVGFPWGRPPPATVVYCLCETVTAGRTLWRAGRTRQFDTLTTELTNIFPLLLERRIMFMRQTNRACRCASRSQKSPLVPCPKLVSDWKTSFIISSLATDIANHCSPCSKKLPAGRRVTNKAVAVATGLCLSRPLSNTLTCGIASFATW